MPSQIGHYLMDFHPIQPPDSTDSTRHHLNELGGQIGWLHCMPAWSNQSNWVIELVKLGGNPQRLCLVELTRHLRQMMPNSTRHHLNEFPPNSTTQFD